MQKLAPIHVTGISDTTAWYPVSGFQASTAVFGTWDSADVTVQHSFDGGTTAFSDPEAALVNATANVEVIAVRPRSVWRLLFNSGDGGTTSLTFVIMPAES